MVQAYPLHWPSNLPRTTYQKQSRFKLTLASARDDLLKKLSSMKATGIVISSNAVLKANGLPLGKQPPLSDTGVAVYFYLGGKQLVIACDKWEELRENIRAIALTLESMRKVSQWGASDVLNQMFTGFTYLPPSDQQQAPPAQPVMSQTMDEVRYWKRVLGVTIGKAVTWPEVKKAYKRRCIETHPDRGGKKEVFQEVAKAFEMAKITFQDKGLPTP